MWSKETWGREEEEGDAKGNTTKGGTRGLDEGGGGISGGLMVVTMEPRQDQSKWLVHQLQHQEWPPEHAQQENVKEQE